MIVRGPQKVNANDLHRIEKTMTRAAQKKNIKDLRRIEKTMIRAVQKKNIKNPRRIKKTMIRAAQKVNLKNLHRIECKYECISKSKRSSLTIIALSYRNTRLENGPPDDRTLLGDRKRKNNR